MQRNILEFIYLKTACEVTPNSPDEKELSNINMSPYGFNPEFWFHFQRSFVIAQQLYMIMQITTAK